MAPRERTKWDLFEKWKKAFLAANPNFRKDVPNPEHRRNIYEAELRAQGVIA